MNIWNLHRFTVQEDPARLVTVMKPTTSNALRGTQKLCPVITDGSANAVSDESDATWENGTIIDTVGRTSDDEFAPMDTQDDAGSDLLPLHAPIVREEEQGTTHFEIPEKK